MSVQSPTSRNQERVPPRRRHPKRPNWRKRVWPILKASAVVVVAIGLGAMVTGKIARPFRLLSTEYRETQRIARERDALRRENATLERRIKYIQTPQGAAEAARKLGYVKPGEITLVLPEPTSPPRK